jgi:hypothetical protein
MRSKRTAKTVLIPLDLILFPEPVTAGMSLYELVAMARFYRNSNKHRKPITVRSVPNAEHFTLTDGRHRCVASMIAGRKTILAEIEAP